MANATSPDFGMTATGRREALNGHYYEYSGLDGARNEHGCYADCFPDFPGDDVTLCIASNTSTSVIDILHDGGVEALVAAIHDIATTSQETQDNCSVEGGG